MALTVPLNLVLLPLLRLPKQFDKSTAGLISFFKDCGLTFPISEPVLSRHLALEYDATPSARPSSSGRLDRRMSRTSSFHISRLTQGSGTVENSPLVPIPDSEEKGISAAKNSHVSLSSGSQDDFVAPRRKRHRSTKAVTSKPSQVEVGTRGLKRWKFAHEGDGPLSITRDYLVRLVRCTRPQGFRPLSLAVSEEKKVYAKLATANSKVTEDRVRLLQDDKEMGSERAKIQELAGGK
ncbi:hypothetical protein F2Q70_00026256 [Brassica cretica]|uniref:Uncharacterized protein n=1 Tax=Brassica cretica TaxID=69181 RepID=A0A8S9L882_BRACR|nr:hypothetical protein F2Q70_00026256 [Brassica cretica]